MRMVAWSCWSVARRGQTRCNFYRSHGSPDEVRSADSGELGFAITFVDSSPGCALFQLLPYKLHWRRERARGGQSPPPPAPPGSGGKIATSWFPQLIPSGFGSGVSSHPCEPRPQPTSLWADPAYGKRFGDLDATKNRAVFKLTAKNTRMSLKPMSPRWKSASRRMEDKVRTPWMAD